MSALGIVPARFASERFPGKPLVPIAGRPMIVHVVEAARRAKSLRDVWVATDDDRIAAACREIDAPVVMTSADHPTGTDRLAEAAAGTSDEIIVNIQGDEPLIEGFVIDAAVDALASAPDVPMSTVVHAAPPEAGADPNRVKVVRDRAGNALYFSRAEVPFERSASAPRWQHVGLYAYRREFLLDYVALEPTPLERAEALEQLRALEHGFTIRCAVVEGWESVPVDTPEDRERVEVLLAAREARDRS